MGYSKYVAGIATALAIFAAPVLSQAQDGSNEVIMKIDGVEIKQSDFSLFESLDSQFAQLQGQQKQLAILSAIIDIKAMAKQAEAENFADSDEFKTRLRFLRDRALHNAYFQENVIKSVSDADLQARYEKEVGASKATQEVRARHILVETEEEAQAIIKELDAGADFVQLAKDKSTGPSGPQGGDLGFFSAGQMVPAFEQAAFALEAGSHTKEPVKTQFGFHVIKLEEKRDRPFPEFAAVKEQIRQVVLQERYLDTVKDASSNVELEILDENLKTLYEQSRK